MALRALCFLRPGAGPLSVTAVFGLLIAACSSNVEQSATESESDAITTSDAIARAEQWVNAKLQYCQAPNHQRDYDTACSTYCNRQNNSVWDPYRSDCSGFVSWAWGLPSPGRVTGQFAPFQNDITKTIQASSLREGDAVNLTAGGHIMLFKAWTIAGKQATFLEEPGCSSSQPYARQFTSNVTINGTSIYVVDHGESFTAIRYDNIELPNALPVGKLANASCKDGISGTAKDPDTTKSITVDLTFDAPTGKPGSGTMHVTTSATDTFDVPVPLGLRDSTMHSVYAYGLDSSGGPSALLGASQTFSCAPPVLPAPGVKRWIANPKALAAWKFDPFLDVAHEPQKTVDGVPKGADLPATPLAVIGDDPAVWIIDGGIRRHVQSAKSLSDWQLTPTKWSAAQITAIPEGEPWPLQPFVFKGDGDPSVYVLDYGANPPTSDNPPTGTANQEPTLNGPAANSGGCNAGGSAPDGTIALLVALSALLRRKAR
jgi:hypothetical protein